MYGCLSKRVALMVACMAESADRHVIAFNTQTSVDIGVLQVAKASESWLGGDRSCGLATGDPKPTCESRDLSLILWLLSQRLESERVVRESLRHGRYRG